jgi:hypothetical protein
MQAALGGRALVTASPDDVQNTRAGIDMQPAGPHGARQACDFSRRLAFGSQQNKEGSDLSAVRAGQQCLSSRVVVQRQQAREAHASKQEAHPQRVLGLLLRQVLASREGLDHLHACVHRPVTCGSPRAWTTRETHLAYSHLPGYGCQDARRCTGRGTQHTPQAQGVSLDSSHWAWTDPATQAAAGLRPLLGGMGAAASAVPRESAQCGGGQHCVAWD